MKLRIILRSHIVFSLLLLLSLGKVANAQTIKPIYFYGDQIVNDKDIADSYAVYGKLKNENTWMYKRYDLWDNLLVTGSYADNALSLPKGNFTFYADIVDFNNEYLTNYSSKFTSRFIAQKGFFKDGKEDGRWTLFYPDGSILNYQHYKDGVLDGQFKTFSRHGEIDIEGNYKNGNMEGEWIFVRLKQVKTYKDGVLLSTKKWTKPKKATGEVGT